MNGGTSSNRNDSEKLRELVHLVGSVSHHVINAFSSIVSNAELIRAHEANVEEGAELESLGAAIVETAIDASEVARQLIDWARRTGAGPGGQPGRAATAVDLDQLVRDAVEAEKSREVSQVEWLLTLESSARVPGDVGALVAMLGFLLTNAQESLPGGVGTIEVSTGTDARNWLVVTIRDTGCGMSAEVLKRATEPFFSTKPERDGVGLTIAQAIWRRNRGALSIESRPGVGTTVRLSIAPASV